MIASNQGHDFWGSSSSTLSWVGSLNLALFSPFVSYPPLLEAVWVPARCFSPWTFSLPTSYFAIERLPDHQISAMRLWLVVFYVLNCNRCPFAVSDWVNFSRRPCEVTIIIAWKLPPLWGITMYYQKKPGPGISWYIQVYPMFTPISSYFHDFNRKWSVIPMGKPYRQGLLRLSGVP
jgi:hypothetical protein